MISASLVPRVNPLRVLLLAIFIVHFGTSSSASGPYTLTIVTVGSGTVSRNPNFPQYPNGSVVTLTATPAADWLFSHWDGDLTGGSSPANIEMSGARSVTAHFVAVPLYNLSTSVSGQGTITLSPPGGSYQSNTVVAASATPAQGWAFASWSGDASGSTGPISIRVDSNKSITANFAELVTITEPPAEVITNSGSTVRFNVTAQGTGPFHYQWSFKDQAINGANTSALTINNAQSTNEGTYSVTVSNLVSSATATAALLLTDSGCTGSNVVTVATEEALRNAIEIGGHVQLCFNGTITLTQAIVVTKDVALDAGPREVTISGNDSTRIFVVQTNTVFAATNLTFANGLHRGENGPEIGGPGFGGAVLNEGGTIILTGCNLKNNRAVGGNAAEHSQNAETSGGDASGGAIFNQHGIIQIFSSVLADNTASGGFGSVFDFLFRTQGGDAFGGAIASLGGSVQITESNFSTNKATAANGGAGPIANAGALYLNNTLGSLSNVVFRGNSAIGSDGNGIDPRETTGAAYGGAIRTVRGQTTIHRSEFTGNFSIGGSGFKERGNVGLGGAIYSEGNVHVHASTFAHNTARSGEALGTDTIPQDAKGGAWYNLLTASSTQSTFHSNLAQGAGMFITMGGAVTAPGNAFGGAIFNGASFALTNCTITLNRAASGHAQGDSYSGSKDTAAGGGIFNSTNSSLIAINLTIASNFGNYIEPEGEQSGTVLGANLANSSNATVTLRNTIVAYPDGTNSNVYGVITDGGHNISSDASANFNSGTSFNFTDPRLGSLADNGGPTLTMALLPGSPAIDFGDSNYAPSTDQRGVSRPIGNEIDIGAYEFSPSNSLSIGITVSGNESVQLSFQASAQTSYQIQSSADLSDWTTIETIAASENSTMIAREFSRSPSHRFYRLIAD